MRTKNKIKMIVEFYGKPLLVEVRKVKGCPLMYILTMETGKGDAYGVGKNFKRAVDNLFEKFLFLKGESLEKNN